MYYIMYSNEVPSDTAYVFGFSSRSLPEVGGSTNVPSL
jgi:hypothetical protein